MLTLEIDIKKKIYATSNCLLFSFGTNHVSKCFFFNSNHGHVDDVCRSTVANL